MSWVHCSCGGELDMPTNRQILEVDVYSCPQCEKDMSGYMNSTIEEVVLALLERIEALENK